MLYRSLNPLRTLAFALLASATLAFAEDKTPVQTIQFAGETYQLAWQSQPSPQYSKYEYLSANDKLPFYQNMLMLEWVVSHGMTPVDAANAQIQFLTERKQSDPVVNHELIHNEKTGEYLLDFVLSAKDPEAGYIIEWNAYRYIPYQAADGTSGVQLFAYSARGYGDEGARTFLTTLKDKRPQFMRALISATVPQRH